MEKSFFYKEINTNSRKEMAFYIKNHFIYNRMNSWNDWKGYANNVKIYNLGLTKEQEEKAYNIILDYEVDTSEFWDNVKECLNYFKEATGYEAYFNGRSDGYIVTDIDIIDYEDLKTMNKMELQKVTEVLQNFDALCDDLREELILFLENGLIIEEVETIIKTKKSLVLEYR